MPLLNDVATGSEFSSPANPKDSQPPNQSAVLGCQPFMLSQYLCTKSPPAAFTKISNLLGPQEQAAGDENSCPPSDSQLPNGVPA